MDVCSNDVFFIIISRIGWEAVELCESDLQSALGNTCSVFIS